MNSDNRKLNGSTAQGEICGSSNYYDIIIYRENRRQSINTSHGQVMHEEIFLSYKYKFIY